MLDLWRDLARVGLHPAWVWTIRLCVPVYALWIVAAIWLSAPWYLSPFVTLAALAGVVLWWLYTTFGPLPALDPRPSEATVIGHSTEIVDEYDRRRPLIHVRVDAPGGTFTSVLADHIADVDRDRFVQGSRWSVRTFVGRQTRVLLGAAHEDVLRIGYHLDGVRYAAECTEWRRPRPGSPLLRRRFRR